MDEVNLVQLVREAIKLAGSLGEELVKMEAESGAKGDFWRGDDFFVVISTFLSSLKQYRGFEIESGSFGSKLADAMTREDSAEMSRYRFEIMSNLKTLSDGKRSSYMFFVFWPKLHLALVDSK